MNDGLEFVDYNAFGYDLEKIVVPASITEIRSFGGAKDVTFLGNAPDMHIFEDGTGIAGLAYADRSYLSGVTIRYSGAGFEPYIEAYPEYNWIKQ